jgi:hypothetical protein
VSGHPTVAVIDDSAKLLERVAYDPYGEARHHAGDWAADLDGDGQVTTAEIQQIQTLAQANGGQGTPDCGSTATIVHVAMAGGMVLAERRDSCGAPGATWCPPRPEFSRPIPAR